MVGTIQIVHHDGVISESDRFFSELAMKARTVKLDRPMSELRREVIYRQTG